MLHSEEACAGSCSPLQEQQLGSARWEGEPCRERACRAANRREKMRLDIEKKIFRVRTIGLSRLPEGAAAQRRDQTSQNPRGQMMK